MAKRKKIPRNPKGHKNYYIVDANFLVYVAFSGSTKSPALKISDSNERKRIDQCIAWWNEIRKQIKKNVARVYVPDICIAEVFKVLAKYYYLKKWLKDSQSYNQAKNRLRKFISTPHRKMAMANRIVRVHDIPTNRDVVIAVDRFFEVFFKQGVNVQIADLILIASAKYLIDFYDIPREHLYILTCDKSLIKGVNYSQLTQGASCFQELSCPLRTNSAGIALLSTGSSGGPHPANLQMFNAEFRSLGNSTPQKGHL